jgi:hypothetical protein
MRLPGTAAEKFSGESGMSEDIGHEAG